MSSPAPDEFVSLYFRYEHKLYRYVASLLSRPSDVEDVLQETAQVLWQKFGEYRREEPFLPWRWDRASQGSQFLPAGADPAPPFQPAVIELLADARLKHDDLLEARSRWLEKCVERLEEVDRRLIQQRYASERTLAELAEETGRTPNALYKSMQRIRRAALGLRERGPPLRGMEMNEMPGKGDRHHLCDDTLRVGARQRAVPANGACPLFPSPRG